jgi:hypothetical protein
MAGRWLNPLYGTQRATETAATHHKGQLIGQTQSTGMEANLFNPN